MVDFNKDFFHKELIKIFKVYNKILIQQICKYLMENKL